MLAYVYAYILDIYVLYHYIMFVNLPILVNMPLYLFYKHILLRGYLTPASLKLHHHWVKHPKISTFQDMPFQCLLGIFARTCCVASILSIQS